MPYLGITKEVLVHFNIVNNNFKQNSRVLYTFLSGKSFSQLSDISPHNFIFLIIFESGFSNIEICFSYQGSKPLEIEDKMIINLVIN